MEWIFFFIFLSLFLINALILESSACGAFRFIIKIVDCLQDSCQLEYLGTKNTCSLYSTGSLVTVFKQLRTVNKKKLFTRMKPSDLNYKERKNVAYVKSTNIYSAAEIF